MNKTENEAYFADLGAKNDQRPDHLPPSQGGKYGGFVILQHQVIPHLTTTTIPTTTIIIIIIVLYHHLLLIISK